MQIEHPDGIIHIEDIESGKRSIFVEPSHSSVYIRRDRCETAYPISLIKAVLAVKGPGYLVDEIERDEDPNYVQRSIKYDVLSYVTRDELGGARILDFGCGAGASTMILARMLPHAEIVGIELEEQLLNIAKLRQDFYGFQNLKLALSPNEMELPVQIGEFDTILMSGVFEHLLPAERLQLLPKVWGHLKTGGILFISQLQHRYFPFEMHTTRLPLINYMPDRVALWCARRFSKKVKQNETWEGLLRRGIRGGTNREILRILDSSSTKPDFLEPRHNNVKDHIDLWFQVTASTRSSWVKKIELFIIRMVKRLTGQVIVPLQSIAIRKPDCQKIVNNAKNL
jgi:2-polyprenyl-3-methyl-5-hydroxy-6-metoxy-1,4-benzoquinol methylase